eukprot:GDKJ01029307.1.p1 GENE.GDKJ01029307.1~~GDKJ01029307.1.p1  ORF type:complete len:717 (-),score=184.49 GDKJ01029307.1:137-2287(-)
MPEWKMKDDDSVFAFTDPSGRLLPIDVAGNVHLPYPPFHQILPNASTGRLMTIPSPSSEDASAEGSVYVIVLEDGSMVAENDLSKELVPDPSNPSAPLTSPTAPFHPIFYFHDPAVDEHSDDAANQQAQTVDKEHRPWVNADGAPVFRCPTDLLPRFPPFPNNKPILADANNKPILPNSSSIPFMTSTCEFVVIAQDNNALAIVKGKDVVRESTGEVLLMHPTLPICYKRPDNAEPVAINPRTKQVEPPLLSQKGESLFVSPSPTGEGFVLLGPLGMPVAVRPSDGQILVSASGDFYYEGGETDDDGLLEEGNFEKFAPLMVEPSENSKNSTSEAALSLEERAALRAQLKLDRKSGNKSTLPSYNDGLSDFGGVSKQRVDSLAGQENSGSNRLHEKTIKVSTLLNTPKASNSNSTTSLSPNSYDAAKDSVEISEQLEQQVLGTSGDRTVDEEGASIDQARKERLQSVQQMLKSGLQEARGKMLNSFAGTMKKDISDPAKQQQIATAMSSNKTLIANSNGIEEAQMNSESEKRKVSSSENVCGACWHDPCCWTVWSLSIVVLFTSWTMALVVILSLSALYPQSLLSKTFMKGGGLRLGQNLFLGMFIGAVSFGVASDSMAGWFFGGAVGVGLSGCVSIVGWRGGIMGGWSGLIMSTVLLWLLGGVEYITTESGVSGIIATTVLGGLLGMFDVGGAKRRNMEFNQRLGFNGKQKKRID